MSTISSRVAFPVGPITSPVLVPTFLDVAHPDTYRVTVPSDGYIGLNDGALGSFLDLRPAPDASAVLGLIGLPEMLQQVQGGPVVSVSLRSVAELGQGTIEIGVIDGAFRDSASVSAATLPATPVPANEGIVDFGLAFYFAPRVWVDPRLLLRVRDVPVSRIQIFDLGLYVLDQRPLFASRQAVGHRSHSDRVAFEGSRSA